MLAHDHAELIGAEYVVFVDAARRYIDCTEAACKLLGYSRDEMLSKTIDDLSYDVDEVPKLFAAYLKKGTLEGEYVLQSKGKIPVPIRYRRSYSATAVTPPSGSPSKIGVSLTWPLYSKSIRPN